MSSAQIHFNKLKVVCVPLMGGSRLTPVTFKTTVDLLTQLIQLVREIPQESLSTNLISYIFLPLSTILQRNSSDEIPDQILEKILTALGLLVESWWWTCDVKIWEQVFMLSGVVIGGVESKSGKGKVRDDETKEAAASCLKALMRPRTTEEATRRCLPAAEVENRLSELQLHAHSPAFVSIIGRTMEAILQSSMSPHRALQHISLDAITYLLKLYLPDPLVPSVLPGVVSTMTKICLGLTGSKGLSNGDTVARALQVIQLVTIKAVNDAICLENGALRRVLDLDDLVNVNEPPHLPKTPSFGTARTESWLRGTASQLYIAFNSLTPLLSHPNASALRALSDLSAYVIQATSLSLYQCHPLLLSFLLSLSLSDYSSVSSTSRQSLLDLLTHSEVRSSLPQILVNQLGNNLSALPHLISTQTDAKVAHTAGMVEAVCRLATKVDSHPGVSLVRKGVGRLLGPSGGIEKWGWSLLAVLELVEPPVVVTHQSSAQLALEADTQLQHIIFPELLFRNLSSHEGKNALVNMFRALGTAGNEAGLYAVGWFFKIGYSSTSSDSVAALWCACRLLEGIGFVSLSEMRPRISATKRLEKECKLLTRSIAEIWDQPDPTPKKQEGITGQHDNLVQVQHQKGLVPLHETLKIVHPTKSNTTVIDHQPNVHRVLCLQLLAISAAICQERFSPLFIHALYPVLHSLVSPVSLLSYTSLATLDSITASTSYALPANLLLSNFDYILDSVSRRLSQRWLDIDATKVLCVMIRLVGVDIVEKAGDVVEECFDRLDEFHGYELVVDGLIEVLYEVLKVIEMEARLNPPKREHTPPLVTKPRKANLDDFFVFLPNRFDHFLDESDHGPVARDPWGKAKEKDDGPKADDDESTPMSDEPPPTVVQSLTKQIISRSKYFLTHNSPVVRSKILRLLSLAVPVLPESVLLPSIHDAWPFILNRLDDAETFVVSADAELVATLAEQVGDFMFRRIWDDVWPKFCVMLRRLEKGETATAMVRRGEVRVGTEYAYTESHRLYRSLLRTMTAAMKGVHPHESSFWEVIVAFRRFLSCHAHDELQQHAVKLYFQANKQNPDAVWLLLTATMSDEGPVLTFLKQPNWNIDRNAMTILQSA